MLACSALGLPAYPFPNSTFVIPRFGVPLFSHLNQVALWYSLQSICPHKCLDLYSMTQEMSASKICHVILLSVLQCKIFQHAAPDPVREERKKKKGEEDRKKGN